MSTFLNKKIRNSILSFLIGLALYIVWTNIDLDTYTGLCIESYQSNQLSKSYSIVGIDVNGERKTVKVYMRKDELPVVGSRVIVSKKLIGHSLERGISSPIDSSKYLFTGEINKLFMGLDVPMDKEVFLEVYQNGQKSVYKLAGRDYFVELQNDKEAKLVFSSFGFKTKELHLTKVYLNSYHVFRANCVFEEGNGTTVRTMNLDSLAKSS